MTDPRCSNCHKHFEVVMFHGRYETSCCGEELELDTNDLDAETIKELNDE